MKEVTEIPTLDIRDFLSNDGSQKAAFVENLAKIYEEIGFVVIKGHEISPAQQKDAYDKIGAFFALPTEKKKSYEVRGIGGARGYTSFGKEHAKDSKVGDLKEFFHVGMALPKGHRLEGHPDYPPNVFVPEIPGFDDTLRQIYDDLLALGMQMLRAIALGLKLPEDYFDERVRYGNSILRPIHYPPVTGREEAGAIRSSAHEDINLITLLIGASSPGLQVKNRQGHWVPITTQPSEIVVNVGDMLQRLTNHKLKSTTHQVVNPPVAPQGPQGGQPATGASARRFSIPFFLHPVSDVSLDALESCVTPSNPKREPAITAGEYLRQRLREIGLA
jgi:isopenicillin N synthase-like dioxygenase